MTPLLPAPYIYGYLPAGPLRRQPPTTLTSAYKLSHPERHYPGDLLERDGKFYVMLAPGMLITEAGTLYTVVEALVHTQFRNVWRDYWTPDAHWQRVLERHERAESAADFWQPETLRTIEHGADRFGRRTYRTEYRRAG